MLHSICQQIWKTQQCPQDCKRSVFIPIPKKGNAKECSNYCTTALLSHASKVMLKILQARLQQYMNHELQDVQAGFRKDRGSRNKIANIIKAAGEFQKNIYYCFPDYAKASCLTLSDPMDCSLPGSSTHGICQARVLEWGAIAFSFIYHSLVQITHITSHVM